MRTDFFITAPLVAVSLVRRVAVGIQRHAIKAIEFTRTMNVLLKENFLEVFGHLRETLEIISSGVRVAGGVPYPYTYGENPYTR